MTWTLTTMAVCQHFYEIDLADHHAVSGVPQWPIYDNTDGYAQEYVFDANVTSYLEYDTFRAEAIQFMIDESASLFNR